MALNAETIRRRASTLTARAVKRVGYHTPLHRLVFYRYEYMFRPGQLAFLCQCLDETSHLSGPVVEIGCAGGHTTVFLNKHLDDLGGQRPYICIDTFDGFIAEDIAAERARGKRSAYEHVFKAYSKQYFERTLANNEVQRASVIQADVNTFDFRGIDDISLCMVDVDLYRPVRSALDAVYPRMAKGGIIVVDDCLDQNEYDGALLAYREFIASHGFPEEVRCSKLGTVVCP